MLREWVSGDEVWGVRKFVFPEELVLDLCGASGHYVPNAADDDIEHCG